MYESPSMEVVEISVESGFEASSSTEDYEDGVFEW